MKLNETELREVFQTILAGLHEKHSTDPIPESQINSILEELRCQASYDNIGQMLEGVISDSLNEYVKIDWSLKLFDQCLSLGDLFIQPLLRATEKVDTVEHWKRNLDTDFCHVLVHHLLKGEHLDEISQIFNILDQKKISFIRNPYAVFFDELENVPNSQSLSDALKVAPQIRYFKRLEEARDVFCEKDLANKCLPDVANFPQGLTSRFLQPIFEKFTFGEISSFSLKIDEFLKDQEVRHQKTTTLWNISKTIRTINKFRAAFGFEKIENADLPPNKTMDMANNLSEIQNKLKSNNFLSNSSPFDDFISSLNSDMLKASNRKTVGLKP